MVNKASSHVQRQTSVSGMKELYLFSTRMPVYDPCGFSLVIITAMPVSPPDTEEALVELDYNHNHGGSAKPIGLCSACEEGGGDGR